MTPSDQALTNQVSSPAPVTNNPVQDVPNSSSPDVNVKGNPGLAHAPPQVATEPIQQSQFMDDFLTLEPSVSTFQPETGLPADVG